METMNNRDKFIVSNVLEEENIDELNVNFVANAGVKDIVGRGLIYNDNVAIIELIKNSKDARSPKIRLAFNDIIQKKDLSLEFAGKPQIIIKDYGRGMSRLDIKDKWLNIAYSEKKNFKDQIYAGNKGVGRFSCDRLGRHLSLYTKSIDDDFLKIDIDWTLFENRGKDDVISSIPLKIEVIDEDIFLNNIDETNFESGTVLVISDLRDAWNEKKLKKLIAEIEKFSPSLDDSFDVYFESNGVFKDAALNHRNKKRINNNILEKLSFKTTNIKSRIDESGDFIETTLFFQNEVLYSYKAINPYPSLRNISVELHYLDTLSKSYFTRSFGIKPNSYGSVFLFYNSFRISPYGNAKNDWLGLDQRKSQGTSRNLGSRDIVGRVDILDENETFSVITSREGLAHNQSYFELIAYDVEEQAILSNGKEDYGFVTKTIRQLESFVVNGIDWNRLSDTLGKLKIISAQDVLREPDRFTMRALSRDSVRVEANKIINSKLDILEFDINEKLISKIHTINENKFTKFIADFVSTTEDKSLDELSSKEKGILKKLLENSKNEVIAAKKETVEIKKKIIEANVKVEEVKSEIKSVEKTLNIEKKKHSYLLATRRTLSPDADGLIHTIKINNIEINEGLDSVIESIQYDELSKDQIISKLSAIKLYSIKSLKMAELATRSGFDKNIDIDVRTVDVVQYIDEYVGIYEKSSDNNGLKTIVLGNNVSFTRSLSILNISIVLDNLLSNSSKWGATSIKFSFGTSNQGDLEVLISDNGYGLSDLFTNTPEEIFNLGVRDEPPEGFEGSGIGLFYSKEILNKMNADIEFIGNNIDLLGACFKVVFK